MSTRPAHSSHILRPEYEGFDLSGPAANAFLQAIVAGARVGIFLIGHDRRFILVNELLARMNGVPAADHVGRRIAEVIPGLAGQGEAALNRVLAGEHFIADVTGETPAAPGVKKTWEEEWFPVLGPDGTVVGAAGIVRELTDERAAQRALAEAYAELEAVFENVPVGLSVYDRDLRAVRLNSRVLAWHGMPEQDATGRHLSELFPAIWSVGRHYYERALRGEHLSADFDRRAHGQIEGPAHLSVTYAPVEHAGEVIGVVSVAMDVSERVQHTRALANAYAEMEAVFNTAPVGLSVYDRDLRAIRINERTIEWNNLDPNRVVGRHPSELFPTIWPRVRENYERALRGERMSAEFDRRSRGQSVGPEHMSVSYAPVEYEGQVIGLVVASVDITERVRQELALADAYAQLEAVFETADVGLAVYDRDLRAVRLNRCVIEWNGMDPATALGQPASQLLAPMWPVVRPFYERALAGERFTTEVDRRTHGQHRGPTQVSISYAPVEHDGRVVGVAAVSVDISQRVEQQRALAEAYSQLEALFDTVPAALAAWDSDLRAVRLNAQALEWNDIEAADWKGKHIWELLPTVWPASRQHFERALAGEHVTVQVDRRQRGQLSGPAQASFSYAPVEHDGKVVGVMIAAVDVTERTTQERALASAYAQLEAMFETAPVGLAVWDRDLRALRINARTCEWNSLDPEHTTGRHISQVFPSIWPLIRGYYERALSGERFTVEVDRRARGQFAGPTHLSNSYAPVELEGRIVGVVVVSVDTSEREAHQRALADAYAQLEAVFNGTPVGLAVYDRQSRLVRANSLVAHWNGFDPEEATGQPMSEVLPHLWPSIRDTHARALSGERLTVEVDRRAAGVMSGPAYTSVSYAPVERDGLVVGVVVSAVDISERVEHERALAGAYAQLQAVFENVPVGITVYSRSLHVVRMNERMAGWNGFNSSELVGRHVSEIFPDFWEELWERYERALRGERSDVDVDRRQQGIRTGPAYTQTSFMPVYLGDDVIGVTVTSTDITHRIEAERRAEASVVFRDDLMSIASHELRTPLTSIIGFSERLERIASASPEVTLGETLDDLSLIHSESSRMGRMLDVLLDLVGLAAGSTDVELEPVAVVPLIRRHARMTRERHPDLQVREEFLAEPIIDSDGDRLAQIVVNLLENAAKYAGPEPQVVIRVR